MSRVADKGMKALEAAGLFEPKSRAAKLRRLLPGIEKALSEGQSVESCQNALKTAGITFPSLNAFHVALHRARQSQASKGPSLPAEVGAPGEQNTPTGPNPQTGEHVTSRAGSLGEPPEGKKSKLIRAERKERLTNPEPSMDDFV